MKKISKGKWSVLVLVIMLTSMVVISACSSGSNSAGNTPANTPSNTPGTQQEKSGPVERPKLTASFYDRGTVPKEVGTPEDNNWSKWIIENTGLNITYEIIPRHESQAKFNVLFASNKAPDVIFEYDTPYRAQLYNQKQIMPIGDLIEEHSVDYKQMMERFPALRKVGSYEDGKMYELGRVSYLHSDAAWYVRKDWLDNLGLEAPTTADELYEIIRAFTEDDPDGNGLDDTFGFDLGPGLGRTLDNMFGNTNYVLNENDELYFQWDRAEAALAFKKSLYDGGFVDKDFLADKTGQKPIQDWLSGKSGFFSGRTLEVENYTRYFKPLRENVPESKVMAIQLPESEFGSFALPLNVPVQMTTVINANAKDPVAAIKLIDFMASEQAAYAFNYGFEGEHYEIGENGCPVQKDAKKFELEIAWNKDYHMLLSNALLGECGFVENLLNPNVPLEKEFIELTLQNQQANLDPNRPVPGVTTEFYLPPLSKDLSLVSTNIKTALEEIYSKAIVSGASYTVEQAMKDAKKTWEDMGGRVLEQYYADWYRNNKEDAFLIKDLYDFLP